MGYDSLQKFIKILDKAGRIKADHRAVKPSFGNYRSH